MLARDNKEIKCVLKELSDDERTRMLIQSKEKFINDQRVREEEMYRKGEAEGMAEGMAKGIVEGIAINAIKMGLSNEQISAFTELSIEEVDKLRNELRD